MVGLLLIIFFATVQFSTMNPYELVGIAAQVSHELGFEKLAPHLPADEQDRRRAIFWCLYSSDRMRECSIIQELTSRDSAAKANLDPRTHD